MKKILFILPSLAVGGLERVQVNIANALAERGYDVTVMTLNPECDLKVELFDKVHYIYKPYKPHPIMRRIPYIRHKFYDDGMWETRASAEKLYKYYVGNENFDVEIGFFRGLPIKIISGGVQKCKSRRLKSHNDLSHEIGVHGEKKFCTDFSTESVVRLAWVHTDFRKATGYKNNFKNIKAVDNAYSAFDKVVCVSNEAQEGFKSVIGDTGNLTTIYNLIPIKQITVQAEKEPEIQIRKSAFNLVLVGRLLDSAKGQLRLIDVVSRLHNEGYDLSLTLIGDGVDEQKIKDEIKHNSAENYIFMTGSQSNPYPYIKNSDLLVCASYFEGYNLTVAEALILGTPVLSTNCTGPNEILESGKYGMIVENSEDGLYSGIKDLLDNPEKMQYYKRKARERLDFFNEEEIIRKIEECF